MAPPKAFQVRSENGCLLQASVSSSMMREIGGMPSRSGRQRLSTSQSTSQLGKLSLRLARTGRECRISPMDPSRTIKILRLVSCSNTPSKSFFANPFGRGCGRSLHCLRGNAAFQEVFALDELNLEIAFAFEARDLLDCSRRKPKRNNHALLVLLSL